MSGKSLNMQPLRVEVITPVGPGHQEIVKQAAASVLKAKMAKPGIFTEITHAIIDDTQAKIGRSAARNKAIKDAKKRGIEWLFFLDADDLVTENLFEDVAPYLNSYDAIWGQIVQMDPGKQTLRERIPQFAPKSFEDFVALPPFQTVQMGHFVRTRVAAKNLFDTSLDAGEDVDYYLRVWSSKRCIKTPKFFFINRRGQHSTGDRSATGVQWNETTDRLIQKWKDKIGLSNAKATDINLKYYEEFIEKVMPQVMQNNHVVKEGEDIVATIQDQGKSYRFVITDPMNYAHNIYLKGKFFKSDFLDKIKSHVPADAVIADIGSNSGNHTVFFLGQCGAKHIECYEPNDFHRSLFEKNMRLNAMEEQVTLHDDALSDDSGKTVYSSDALARMARPCVTKKEVAGDSVAKETKSLDEVYQGDKLDFLKISADSMGVEVLNGAREIIKKHKPKIAVEVHSASFVDFREWRKENGYKVVIEHPYSNMADYLLEPV